MHLMKIQGNISAGAPSYLDVTNQYSIDDEFGFCGDRQYALADDERIQEESHRHFPVNGQNITYSDC